MTTQTDELTDLLASLTEEPACEGYSHDDGEVGHIPGTPAEWVVLFRCPSCGIGGSILLCDGRYQHWVSDSRAGYTVELARCLHDVPIKDALVSAVRL